MSMNDFLLFLLTLNKLLSFGEVVLHSSVEMKFNNDVDNKFVAFTENALLRWHLSIIIIINYRVLNINLFEFL